jgi:hypothetical protein
MQDHNVEPPPVRSRSADTAAARWGESHPDEEVEHPPPVAPDELHPGVPNHHSASAEAAALRWEEQHPEPD